MWGWGKTKVQVVITETAWHNGTLWVYFEVKGERTVGGGIPLLEGDTMRDLQRKVNKRARELWQTEEFNEKAPERFQKAQWTLKV